MPFRFDLPFAGNALLPASLVAALLVASGAHGQDAPRREQVHFAPGATGTSLSDRIVGRDSVVYQIGAEAGQRMTITLKPDNAATYFNVYAPGSGPGDQALAVSELTGPMVPEMNRFDGVLPASGTYSVSVYLYRNAARRGEASAYTLDIAISGKTGATVQGDYADGLQGGPDFWRVTAAGGLNLRSGPSSGASVIGKLPDGGALRNLGCRMAEGRRWCHVATLADPGAEGWAAGDFLVEGDGTAAPGAADALVPGTAFHATGSVDCYAAPGAAKQMCDFGVIREGNGTGTVQVTLPGGPSRAIFYDGGLPVGFDQSQADGAITFKATRQGDASVVDIGPARFVIPDAVIYGG